MCRLRGFLLDCISWSVEDGVAVDEIDAMGDAMDMEEGIEGGCCEADAMSC